MAKFETSLERTLKFEGGYSLDRDDPGGETYKGIARRSSPAWPGWRIVDDLRANREFPLALDRSTELQVCVRTYYRIEFWDRICGDEIAKQPLADELFDAAVNLGVRRAATLLQRSLNLLNRGASLYPDLDEDGSIGAETLKALAAFVAEDPPELLLKVMTILRGMHYLAVMTKDSTQEKFARGWLARVSL